MDSHETPISRGDPVEPQKSHYDLIVVGAGVAGLNALHAASLYLLPSARVLLIDAKDKPGGMWTMAYDYVRLHQPHPLFTVGGLRWNWQKPAHYLAARDDVQFHLATCLETLRDRFELEERFAHQASGVREVSRSGKWVAQVDVHPVGKPDQTITVQADRVIHAVGFTIVTRHHQATAALPSHPGWPVAMMKPSTSWNSSTRS